MCFSATASFVAAGLNASAGAAVLSRAGGTKDGTLATFPLVFASQQVIEGFLWLVVPQNAAGETGFILANLFVAIALVVWPVLVPLSAYRAEQQRGRRVGIGALLVFGTVFAAYAGYDLIQHPYQAQILNRCIAYSNRQYVPWSYSGLYVLFTCGPMFLSSNRSLNLLGLCILGGLVVSAGLFFYTLLSVWCFFAALASSLIFFRVYFETTGASRLPAFAGQKSHEH
jgi:hypothetical protein